MVFTDPLFWLFFFIVFPIQFKLRRFTRTRLWFLLFVSLFFYGFWNWKFIFLLLFSITVDFWAARRMERSTQHKKAYLVVSMLANLGSLAVFKYANMFFEIIANPLLSFVGQAPIPAMEIILPVGISFYTFQSMSYTIDVYRGVLPARKDFLPFAASVSLFPQLVAGPIVRPLDLLPQIEKSALLSTIRFLPAALLITVGLFKKTVADMLAPVSDAFFSNPDSASFIDAWAGTLAFTGQIYGDFSGYTDIAIGLGLLLGYRFPLNFRLPYLATSPIDFWRRWHISLSSWLRDYLYIPLGGRKRRNFSLLVTMLLGGLWHGASYTFLIWGAYHGILLVMTHKTLWLLERYKFPEPSVWLKRLLTFYLVVLGWVFFRAESLDDAIKILMTLHGFGDIILKPESGILNIYWVIMALIGCHFVDWLIQTKDSLFARGWTVWPVATLFLVFFMLFREPGRPFIYFQF
jgi:alginate O-acetyltransferase complex protein AlgI